MSGILGFSNLLFTPEYILLKCINNILKHDHFSSDGLKYGFRSPIISNCAFPLCYVRARQNQLGSGIRDISKNNYICLCYQERHLQQIH